MSKEVMKLGPLSAKLGEQTRQIQRIGDEGFFPAPETKGAYDVWSVARGVIQYYKTKASGMSEEKAASMARRQAAEAETAEIALAEKKGELVPKDGARLFVADLTVEMRKLISSKPQWKAKELLLALGKIKAQDGK